ncbi:MAG TPA: hypothetical protein VMR33_20105 [Candidatus Baltobacteraceae bacterium]|jgi:hypothetical protein|nr:hypothetical protein [Candidatus Baltobacteraceae bacterium]
MNIPRTMRSCLAALLPIFSAQAQGTFQNLDFELGNPGSGSFNLSVPVADALPDWSVNYGSVQQTDIGYNVVSLGATDVSLIGPGGPGGGPIDGNYSVLLQGGPSSASISQTGVIPAGTQTLLFEAESSGPLDVFIGGQDVPFSAVGSGPNFTLYGANISAWQGQPEQLTFSVLAGSAAFNSWELDDISFSTQAIPEASPLVLTGTAGLLFALYRRFAARRH